MSVERLHAVIDDLADQLQERGQVWAVLVVAAAIVGTGIWLYGRTSPAPVVVRSGGGARESPATNTTTTETTATETTATETTIAVHVGGAVRRPGMVWLAAGARLNDAVRLAGGPIAGADLDSVNLASRLNDGQQIVVPRKGEAAAGGGAQPGASGAPGGAPAGGAGAVGDTVEINSATVEQFDSLPGIGPVLAQRLFDYRTENGPFRSVDDLQQVEGIGPKKFAQLRSKASCKP